MTPLRFQTASRRFRRGAVGQSQLGRPQAVPRPRLALPMQVLGQARALQDGVESDEGWSSSLWGVSPTVHMFT